MSLMNIAETPLQRTSGDRSEIAWPNPRAVCRVLHASVSTVTAARLRRNEILQLRADVPRLLLSAPAVVTSA